MKRLFLVFLLVALAACVPGGRRALEEKAGVAAAPTPTSTPTSAPTPTPTPAPKPTPTPTPTPTSASVLTTTLTSTSEVVAKVGPAGYLDFRVPVVDVALAHLILEFEADGLYRLRVVCDDECVSFVVVAADGTKAELKPDEVYPAGFDYGTLTPEEKELVEGLGVNTEEGEILSQNLFLSPISFRTGDRLVVSAKDQRGVNVGIFISWREIQKN